MKSNVVLQSESRILLGSKVSVMSKDGFVCLTEAMKIVDEKREKMGLSSRKISDIFNSATVKERIIQLYNKLTDRNIWTSKKIEVKDGVLNISTLSDLRKIGLAYRKGKSDDQRWFIDPYLFVTIVMEADPEVYAEIVIWLTDGLIKNRNEAGDAYIEMCSAISKMTDAKGEEFRGLIKGVAKAINFIIFNEHYEGRRNYASSNELDQIVRLEIIISTLINDGFIKTYDDLVEYLRKEWKKRWGGNPIDNALAR